MEKRYKKVNHETLEFKNFNNCCGSSFSNYSKDQTTNILNKVQYNYGLVGQVLNAGIEARENYLSDKDQPQIIDDTTPKEEPKDYSNYYVYGGIGLGLLVIGGIIYYKFIYKK